MTGLIRLGWAKAISLEDLLGSRAQDEIQEALGQGFLLAGRHQGRRIDNGLVPLGFGHYFHLPLGNPETVPVGRYTQEALTKAGLWETLKPKFIYGESVRQVLDYVSRGEVDAGFVFATDAAIAQGKVKMVTEAQGHQPIIYPVALVAASQKKALAQSFLDFILSPAAQEIFKRHGFGPA